ncbi:ParB/RepB/Spo0J family partition protein [Streptomyces sp. NBC_00690]|uniref:ParB/RepB/Spo0J family partition protein n=1 Tax=Streptomyces sp. NBC_00690 TaxID=2975808 RepID=UPI002E299B0C|nr:ParB/RepB/Spo0J family partition protein [Streptomyces sp. NBC_00690]
MSTVGDRLGSGTSFGRASRASGLSARGRAKAVAQGDVPAYELVRLLLDQVCPTPLNPRRNFGSEEEMTRFGEELRQAQLAACVVVSRDAYLALWPDHATGIGDAEHVLVNGERRFRSARHVGLESLDFVVRNDLASTREDFVNHLLKENLEREDFDVIERARGVRELVRVCAEQSESGARTQAAKRLGRDRSWVTNQLALLQLPDEIQSMLSSGDVPERDGRLLARRQKEMPDADSATLLAHLKEVRAAEAREREEAKAILKAAKNRGAADSSPPVVLSADNTTIPLPAQLPATEVLSADNKSHSPAKEAETLSADNTPAASSKPATPPALALSAPAPSSGKTREAKEGRASSIAHRPAEEAETEDLWGDPERACQHIVAKMTSAHRRRLTALLFRYNTEEADSVAVNGDKDV